MDAQSIEEFADKRYLQFKYIKSLNVEKGILSYEEGVSVTLILATTPDLEGEEMKICFVNARDIKIGNLNNLVPSTIQIENISAFQLEDIHFRVSDKG